MEYARRILREYGLDADPRSPALYEAAFRHPSAAARAGGSAPKRHAVRDDSYQRLEFLGDAVLGMVVASYLFDRYPGCNEGFLTNLRSLLVNGSMLSFLAVRLGMPAQMVISDAAEAAGVRDSPKAHEDVFEAFVGAVYLDFGSGGGGYAAAHAFLVRVYERYVDFAELVCKNDPTERLLQWARMIGEDPVVRTVSIDPLPGDTTREYVTQVLASGRVIGTGRGASRREAEARAAAAALAPR